MEARLSWLIEFSITHACGNLSARDAVEDEESPNTCEDDTSSESSDSDDSSTYVEESFEVMFVPEEEMWRGGGVEINFCLIRGEYDLVLGRISHISQSPSLQVIIALSLSSLAGGSGEGEMKKVYPCMRQGAEI